MGLVFTKPILKDGKTNYSSTTDFSFGTKVVDGDLLSDNFQAIYRQVNGDLHASNLLSEGQYMASISDSLIQFPEYFTVGSDWVPGKGHSHDGLDSAVVGHEAVNMLTTRYRSFGAWMMPSHKVTGMLWWGSAQIITPPQDGKNWISMLFDIPYDTERFDVYADSAAFYRPIVQLRNGPGDSSLVGKVVVASAKIYGNYVDSDFNFDPYLFVAIQFTTSKLWQSIGNLKDTFVDWVMLGHVKRTL